MFQQPSFQSPSPLASFNYNAPQMMERGALAVRQKHDFFRNLWGVPEDLARMMESNSNMGAFDIIGQYKERALQIPSAQLTAAILNGQASWLSDTASPIFPTAEFNFQAQFREMNQIEYTRTAVGGIPHEQTYRTTSWKDTIEKVQLNARLEMDLSLDPNFGEDQWLFQLAGLASNAMLTIHKTIAYSLIHIAYTNNVGENVKLNAYDLSRALEMEAEAFGLAAFDQTRLLRLIRRERDHILDFDTVIVPHGAIAYLSELKGESTSMQSQKVQMDPVTQQLQWEMCKGKKSVMTTVYGDEVMHFVEMPQFRINMKRDASKEQIMRTSVTVAQAYQVDPDVKVGVLDTGAMKQENLDFYLFNQTKTQGDEAKVTITDAYAAAFYWDEEGSRRDGLSDFVHSYCRFKNTQIQQDPNTIPWEYNTANNRRINKDNNINREPNYDYDTPNVDYLRDKENILDMRGWRDQFFGLIYLPDKQEFRAPKRVVDFALDVLPNRAIHKAAKGIAHVANMMTSQNMDFDAMVNETYRLLNDIDNSPWTDEWIAALINANIEKMYNFNELEDGKPTFNPATKSPHSEDHDGKTSLFANATALKEWRGDRFGALELPKKNGRITQVYPPGFGSGPGLERLAQEADDDTSEWKEVGVRAKRVVAFLDMLDSLIREYIGPSDVNNECLTPPWFHVNSPIAVLVDSFRHYKSPVFLAVPQQTTVNAKALNPAKLKKLYDKNVVDDVNAFMSDRANESSALISSITKFTVIINTYIGDNNIGRILLETLLNTNSKLSAPLIHRLIDYTIKAVYNQPNTDLKVTLATVAYMVQSIVTAASDNAKLAIVDKELDLVLNANKSKKDQVEVAALLEKIGKLGLPDNSAKVNAIVVKMIEREARLRDLKIVPRDSPYSYDDRVQAVNDYYRLTNPSSQSEQRRKDEAEAIIGEAVGTNKDGSFKQSAQGRGKSSISIDLTNPVPLTFLRSPLVSGDRLLEYMQRSSNPLIRPSDPAVFHEAPLDIVNEETMGHPVFGAHKKGTRVHCNALPYSQIFRQGLNGQSFGSTEQDYQPQSSRNKKTYSSARSRDISQFIGKGLSAPRFDDMDDDYHTLSEKGKKSSVYPSRRAGEKDEDWETREANFKKYLEEDEYFGPHEARYAYINTISSSFEKILFKCIMLAPNRVIIHNKLAAIGQKLVNVLIFRLFIQHIMSSIIVMKAGKDTIKTAVGHGKVWYDFFAFFLICFSFILTY